jgi:predicted DNA binding protein
MLYQLSLKIQHGCDYSLFSSKHPGIRLRLWCNYQEDILEIIGNSQGYFEKAKTDVDRLGLIMKKTDLGESIHVIVRKCVCQESKDSPCCIYDSLNALVIPPVEILDGIERVQVLLFQDVVSKLLEELKGVCKAELVNIQPIQSHEKSYPLLLQSEKFQNILSKRQLEALTLAAKHGYYAIPRRIKTEQLASQMGISRRTFNEHLHKAEGKIVHALVPLLLFKK